MSVAPSEESGSTILGEVIYQAAPCVHSRQFPTDQRFFHRGFCLQVKQPEKTAAQAGRRLFATKNSDGKLWSKLQGTAQIIQINDFQD